ncbi:hypothetical protein FQR65_LT13647 [Abscondita terminalis]|nr:hypothetical protein FQR65_LT13647 [Abscondita terminalis]
MNAVYIPPDVDELTDEENIDDDSVSHFRITRHCFTVLIGSLAPCLKKLQGSIGKNRIVVERQILAATWLLATSASCTRLCDLHMNRLEIIPATIIACCVLHKLCLMSGDELLDLYILEGQPYVLNDENVLEDVLVENVRAVQNLGAARRDDLAAQIYQNQQGNNKNI